MLWQKAPVLCLFFVHFSIFFAVDIVDICVIGTKIKYNIAQLWAQTEATWGECRDASHQRMRKLGRVVVFVGDGDGSRGSSC